MVTDSGVPPALGHVYQGTWARTGNREFKFTFLGFQYVPPVPEIEFPAFYHFRHHETIRLDRSGETYDSLAGSTEFLDSNYSVTDGPFIDPPGVTHGMRLHAE